MIEKIALGTVQLGMPYGVTNTAGQPEYSTARDLVAAALGDGINMLDTAHAYGASEQVLGRILDSMSSRPDIVTKLPPLLVSGEAELSNAHVAAATLAFRTSLENLGGDSVHGLLTHRAQDLLSTGGEKIWAMLEEQVAEGKVRRIGVSVYSPEEAERIADKYPISIIQLPANVYDSRFLQSGLISQFAAAKIEIHVRSLFLQGVLLSDGENLPRFFDPYKSHHAGYLRYLAEAGISPIAGCLCPYLIHPDISHVVIGCQNTAELAEIIVAADAAIAIPVAQREYLGTRFALNETNLINPASWTT